MSRTVTERTLPLPRRWGIRYGRLWGRWFVDLVRKPDPGCEACGGTGSIQGSRDPEDGDVCPRCWTRSRQILPLRLRRRPSSDSPF